MNLIYMTALTCSLQDIRANITSESIQIPHAIVKVDESPLPSSNTCELVVNCRGPKGPIAFYSIITGSDGQFLDGGKRGLYQGGRFAADGTCQVTAKPGKTKIEIRSGPDYEPAIKEIDLRSGTKTQIDFTLSPWFSPESKGWYGGDNHVHAAHDQSGEIKTDLAYAALQARASGLSFVTQASSEFPFEDHLKLSTPDFLLRRSLENRQGSFAGHLNSPGVELPQKDREATMHAAMPVLATVEWVHAHNAAIIHTHTMVPAHQLHWMGAAEAYSYSLLGICPDAMDLDGEASENLWFTVLNLGNKISCSGSTDAALERTSSPAPGARRMYVRSDKFDYEEFVKGIRAGKTFATNAGPLFAFVNMDGHGIAETVPTGQHKLELEIDSLYPLNRAELIHNGAVIQRFEVGGKLGKTTIRCDLKDDKSGWYVCRVHDNSGNWVVTSPIYAKAARQEPKSFGASTIFEIGNFNRLAGVRKNFMAHFIATVSPGDPLAKVELLLDSKPVKEFTPNMADHVVGNKTPVTETFGEYSPGWLWYPSPTAAVRFQSDWDVTVTGWYQVRATTRSGRVITSDEIRFDSTTPVSHEISTANVFSEGVTVRHWGYGESIPLAQVPNPDGWWYPDHTFFKMSTDFNGAKWGQTSGDAVRESSTFRAIGGMTKK